MERGGWQGGGGRGKAAPPEGKGLGRAGAAGGAQSGPPKGGQDPRLHKGAGNGAASAPGKGGQKGDEKGKGKAPGALKAAKPAGRDPLDWEDDDFPKLGDRRAIQARVDAEKLGELRAQARKRYREQLGQDPATFDRQWKIKLGLTAIENTTGKDWNIFIACSIIRASALSDKRRLSGDFKYTSSYAVAHNTRKRLKRIEVLFTKKWVGSYRSMMANVLVMDLWLVSHSGFNQYVGSAVKSLYDIANDRVNQTLSIKPGTEKRRDFDVGLLTLSATISEVFEFTIVASNWQFAPRRELLGDASGKYLTIEMPESPDGGRTSHTTEVARGPRYCWAQAGEYLYYGTKVSLSMEALVVTVTGRGGVQGKAIVSLGSAIDYPIAVGTVKALTRDRDKFVQGKVAGSLAITSRSMLLSEDQKDEHPSVAAPAQPIDSLVLFHLPPKLQYLIVELHGADGLPIADVDSGTSNPLCRVRFDGTVQQSEPILGSTNPTWGHTFYLPVRLADEALRTDRWFLQHIMPVEMQSKGFLELEIWHWNTVPTEFLGGAKLDLQETRYGDIDTKAICQNKTISARRPGDDEDDDFELEIGVHPRLCKKYHTKVYSTNKLKLSGSGLHAATTATISFRCYFIPDFPANFAYPDQGGDATAKTAFLDDFRAWDQFWPKFTAAYAAWFPDAPQGRRFSSSFASLGREDMPLPILVTPLALPASLATPLKVLHWVKCLEFAVPARQKANGQIHAWQQPVDSLALHRGSVQDHAALLCCALQGLGKHAYVCKGTIQGGREHAWVMTREHGGTITFWETTTGAKYHLPGRWLGNFAPKPDDRERVGERWARRNLMPKWNERDVIYARQAMSRAQRMKSLEELQALPIAPWPELCAPATVAVVPYDSVEVVFNGAQLWGNLGNHHPSCVFYDMEHDPRSWQPLIGESGRSRLQDQKDIAIPVGPPMSEYAAALLQESIEVELKESIRLMRIRQGHESYFEDDATMQNVLEEFLNFLESECTLESDWVFDPSGQLRRPWGAPSPFNSAAYVGHCRKAWAAYWKRRQDMSQLRAYVPVKENHLLSGIPVHFSCVDLREIRKNLFSCKPILEYFDLESDDAIFFACARVFPMPSTVASVWLFLGVETPLPEETVYALAKEQQREIDRKSVV